MKRMMSLLLTILMLYSVAAVGFAADSAAVSVTAQSAVLMDQATGRVLFSKHEHKKMYPASVTKIMSLLLIMEALDSGRLKKGDTVTASAYAAQKGGSQIWLKEGETMTVDELLRATAIGSANDACTALAEQIAGSETGFVRMMNDRAKELGMEDTSFDNCTGLDDDTTSHLTSAYDIALMSRELLKHKDVQEYTTVWMDSLRDGATQLVNTNKLVRFYQGTTGLKTGTTSKAGCCVSASAERDGLHLIAVVLHAANSNERFADARSMLDWGFANFVSFTPKIEQKQLSDVKVLRGIEETVRVIPDKVEPLLLEAGKKDSLETTIELQQEVEAPVEEGQVLGSVTFSSGGETLSKVELRAASAVREITLFDVLKRMLSSLSSRA